MSKKRLILDAARKLLVERGFQDIVLDDVAKAASVAKGTLFLYYRSKDELLASVYADLADQLGEALRAIASSPEKGPRLLEEATTTILNHFDRHRDFLSQCHSKTFQTHGRRFQKMLFQKFKENTGHLRAILKRCAREGLISSENLSYAAFALIGLCRSAMLAKLIAGSKEPLTRETAKVLGFFLHGARNSP